MAEFDLSTSDLLVFVGFASSTYQDGRQHDSAKNTFNIHQSATVLSSAQQDTQKFQIQQAVNVQVVRNLTAHNSFPLGQQGTKTAEHSINQLFVIQQRAVKVLPQDVRQTLVFLDSASYTPGLTNFFAIQQLAHCNIVKVLHVTQTLSLSFGRTALNEKNKNFIAIDQANSIGSYDPSQLEIPPVPTVHYPIIFSAGTTSLSYSNFEYGDSDKIEHTRISRRTLGEELIIFRESFWPKTETLKFKLIDLSQQQGKNLLQFISDFLAQQITLTDWLGVTWLGVITNPDSATLVQTTRVDNCSGRFEIEIEFQGVQT